jgi:hypothetical protein
MKQGEEEKRKQLVPGQFAFLGRREPCLSVQRRRLGFVGKLSESDIGQAAKLLEPIHSQSLAGKPTSHGGDADIQPIGNICLPYPLALKIGL